MHDAAALRLSMDLPNVLEVVDTEEHIQGVLSRLDETLKEGPVTLRKARMVRRARPERGPPAQGARWSRSTASLESSPTRCG
jgi:hypothetical protein